MIRALKEFRVYILHSHITTYVPSASINEILTRSNPDGRRAKWIGVLLEHDFEIKPRKIIKGQGLAKLMAQSNYDALEINLLDVDLTSISCSKQVEIFPDFLASSWYKDIIYVLQHLQAPSGLSKTQERFVKLKAKKIVSLINIYIGRI